MQTQFLKPFLDSRDGKEISKHNCCLELLLETALGRPDFLANLALTTYSHHPLHSLQCQGELVQLEILYLKLIIFINPK